MNIYQLLLGYSGHKLLRAFFRNVRVVLWAILDGLALLTTPFQPPRKVVLIVRLDAIGDFVLWLDAARTLVGHYHAQGYTVVLLGNQAWSSWAGEMRLVDEVWGIDTQRFVRNLPYRWHWLRRIHRAGFSIAIQPTISRVFLIGDSAIRASGAPIRIGSAGDSISSWHKRWDDRLFTKLIPASDRPMMELRRNAEFMRGLGITDFKARLPIIPPSSTGRSVDLPPQPYAVLFPGASWYGKEWQSAKFAEIGFRLASHGLHVLLAGGKTDRECANQLVKQLHGKAINLVGKTSLGGLAEVLRNAIVVITNDTSAVHIGAAVGAPVVCIMGGGHYGRFAPYDVEVPDSTQKLPLIVVKTMPCFGCNWVCIYPHGKHEPVKCIHDVTVEDVWNAVEKILAARQHQWISHA